MTDNQNVQKQDEGLSYDTKTLIVVLMLIFVYPIGIILMFIWMKWRIWIKLLIALPVILLLIALIGIFTIAFLGAANPGGTIKKVNCMKACKKQNYNQNICIQRCSAQEYYR